jgi:hypothetical protein
VTNLGPSDISLAPEVDEDHVRLAVVLAMVGEVAPLLELNAQELARAPELFPVDATDATDPFGVAVRNSLLGLISQRSALQQAAPVTRGVTSGAEPVAPATRCSATAAKAAALHRQAGRYTWAGR